VVLPHNIKTGEKSVIICKSRTPGNLQVDLFSKDGKLLNTLFKGKMKSEFHTMTWDGKDPSKKTKYSGEYKIRWTTAGGYREFPVNVL
jgi:flagellar hook assembly protein FlgD